MSTPSIQQSDRASHGFPRLRCLDGLRGLAILFILVSHGRFSVGFPALPFAFIDGSPAVAFFLITSGLLITTQLLDEGERYGRVDLWHYLCRRGLRIFPSLYIYLAAVTVLGIAGVIHFDPIGLMIAALHVRNLYDGHSFWSVSHMWTLSMQEQFYLFWPVLITRFRPAVAATVAILMVMAWPLLRFLRHGYFAPPDPVRALDAPGMHTIFYGCLLAMALRGGRSLKVLQGIGSGPWALLAGATTIMVIYQSAPQWQPEWIIVLGPLRNLSVVAIVWWCILHPQVWVGRFLESPVPVFLGRISFSLYLWQQLFLGFNRGWLAEYPQNLAFALLAGTAAHFLIERPFERFRVHFKARRWTGLRWEDRAASSSSTDPVPVTS